HHRHQGWRITHLHLQPLSPGLCLGPSAYQLHWAPSSPQTSALLAVPRRSVPLAP
ncbi:hypothetical protein M9458_025988, partial [Cirrhinus mrigala]